MTSVRRQKILFFFLIITFFYCNFFWILKLYHTKTNPLLEEEAEEFLEPGLIKNPQNFTTRKLPVSHVFVVSAYYYPTSKSLGPNAVALNMVVDCKSFNVDNATYSVMGSNQTHHELSKAPSQVEGVPSCRYTTAMARTNTVENLVKLEMESEGKTVEIPFKIARYKSPKPVVICISPQFVAEQWQLFLLQAHVAHQFGGHLHIYLTSIINSYFKLIREYERLGYLTVDYWLRMKFFKVSTPYFEPNSHVEWRNQAGAQIDCLLQYKEAAEFIAFFDMDDVLFPKTYPTYLQEFRAEWEVDPSSNSIYYGRREHEFLKAETLSEFSFKDIVSSLRSSPTVKRGKVVVKPERYNSTWIHYSWHDLNSRVIQSPNLVHVQRPLQKNGENNVTKVWQMEFGPLNETIKEEDIYSIEDAFNSVRDSFAVSEISSKLPSADFYLPIVFNCYYKAFYGAAFDNQPGGFGCPNADSCDLPQRDQYRTLIYANGCEIPDWNQVTTEEVPHAADFRKWAAMQLGALRNILDAEARLLSAFVYTDQISIITTSQHSDNQNVTCLYYDCNRRMIPHSQFETIVVPMTVVTCPRRPGVEFVSIRFNATEKPHEPIPLTFRIYEKPIHELAVCVGPLYGNESKWLQIVEYVEHYKLLGASYFYFTIFNLNEYDRKMIDYYARMGYAEYTSYLTEYQQLNWMFHLIQTQECHHRSRHHSKWVLNLDTDERVVYTGPGDFLGFLRSQPDDIGELSFIINRVLKTEENPKKFTNFTKLSSEFMFLKYNKTTEMSWFNVKGVIRPDLVFVLFYHWSYRQKEGVRVVSVPKRIAHIRHYRSVDIDALNGNWLENYSGKFKGTKLDPKFEQNLIQAVKQKVKYVYEQRWIRCEEIPEMYFRRFGRKILDCKFRNETVNE